MIEKYKKVAVIGAGALVLWANVDGLDAGAPPPRMAAPKRKAPKVDVKADEEDDDDDVSRVAPTNRVWGD